jgi:predicted acylesterase/phospholipase RssA/CRP-like cAMP-binding protein
MAVNERDWPIPHTEPSSRFIGTSRRKLEDVATTDRRWRATNLSTMDGGQAGDGAADDWAGVAGTATGSANALQSLAAVGVQTPLATGSVLVEQGAVGDTAFVLTSGSLGVQVATDNGSMIAAEVHAPALVGEVAVLAGLPRSSTLIAVGDATVSAVDRDQLLTWLADQPLVAAAITAEAHDRLRRAQLARMVADVLATPDTAAVAALVQHARITQVDGGAVLYREGEVAGTVAFVLSGRLRVTRRTTGGDATDEHDVTVGEIGSGEMVGEMAMLQQSVRNATVAALRDTTLAEVDVEAFEGLMAQHPALTLGAARSVIRRLLTPRHVQRNHQTLALVRVAGLDRAELRDVPLSTLRRHGSVAVLGSDDVDRLVGADGAAQAESPSLGDARVVHAIEEIEASHRFVVLLADDAMAGDPTSWTRRAVQRADRLLVIAPARPNAAEAAAIRRVMQLRTNGGAPAWLVMIDPASAERPTPAAATGVRSLFDAVHHVRRSNTADLARVTRLAAGVGYGLVLGGGGARGFAHIGVIRALNELQVPVDCVGGASMGSIFAAASALYSDPDDMMSACAPQFDKLLDYTIPVVSLLKAKRISANLNTIFGGLDAEDLWRPFYCVSTNLTKSRQEVHRHGNLVTAIRASIAIPGVLPPVPWGDSLLVDGGVLDNVPVSAMAADPSIGTIIAVDVAPAAGPQAAEDYGMYVSGWQALRGLVRRRQTSPYPGVGSVLVRTMMTSSEGKRSALADDPRISLYLDLDIAGVGLLEFDQMQPVMETGYRLAEPRVRDWVTKQPARSSAS